MDRSIFRKEGFTLVELLVVIGIIAVLIAILLPALSRAKVQARRTQDLSNIHQMAIACVAYATENHGDWPLGDRGGPNLNVEPIYNDDISWINAYTFQYFLSFECDTSTAQKWMNPDTSVNTLDLTQQRRFCCTSMADAYYSAQTLAYVGLANVGVPTWRYYQNQTDPNGAGYNETYMGFFYWGRRANAIQGPIYDQTGTAVSPTQTFTYPLKQGVKSSSRILLTCPAYTSTGSGDYTEYAHCYRTDTFTQFANVTSASPGNGVSGPSSAMQGICCAYVDGSARWVARRQLWSVLEGGLAYVYFDNSY